MTMIMGLNLSSKVYLASDTRVSFPYGSHQDNILKAVPIIDRFYHKKNEINMAVAGNVGLTSYLHKKITDALNTGTISTDIRKFCTGIDDVVDRAIVGWVNDGKPYKNCCLLFAGTCKDRPKKIDPDKLRNLIKLFEEGAIRRRQELDDKKFHEQIKTDPIWRQIDEKMKKEAGMSVLDNIKKSFIPSPRESLKQALESGIDYLVDDPDSLIFGLKIDVKTRRIDKEIAEWGDFLVYGDRVNRTSIPEDLLSMFELSWAQQPQHSSHIMEGTIMTTEILELAKEQNIGSIGGTVLFLWADALGTHFGGKDYIKKNPVSVRIGDKIQPLIPFFSYPNKVSGMEMEM